MRRGWAKLIVPLALMVLAGGCTSDDGTDVASAGGAAPGGAAPSVAASASPAGDVHEREVQFVACMRAEGISIIDPIPGDDSGRSAVKHELDVNGQGDNPKFQEALDKCSRFLPDVPAEKPPAGDELAQLRAFSQCMRDHGLSDFPDPGPDGGRIVYTPADARRRASGGIQLATAGNRIVMVRTPATEAALAQCKHLVPPDPSAPAG